MLKVDDVNLMNRAEFIKTFASIFEHSPWIAELTADRRPFGNREEFFTKLCEPVIHADESQKLTLIRLHPDLVGREVLTRESQNEQTSAGLGQLSEDEVTQFKKYNFQYREKFGFPFVICARLNKKQAILDSFPVRLQNSPEQEMKIALNEIFKIAKLRLEDLVT